MFTLSYELLTHLQVMLRSGTLISCRPVWGNKNASADFNKFYFVLDGEFIYEIGNHHYLVKRNQMAFIPADVPHSCYLTKKQKLHKYYAHFSASIDGVDLFQQLGISENQYVVSFQDPSVMEKLFQNLFFYTDFYNDMAKRIHQQGVLTDIIATYIEECFKSASVSPAKQEKFDSLLTYMETHISENVTLETLARLSFMNPNQLVRDFKQAFGVPPMRYFDAMRIEKASALLRDTDMPLQFISNAIGIADQAYFSRFFKNRAGIPPSEYRKSFR